MAGLALLGICITLLIVPSPRRLSLHRDAETVPAMLGSVLKNKELVRLDFGIFALHAMLTASFLGYRALAPNFQRDKPQPVDRLFARPACVHCSDGPGDHRRRKIPAHESRAHRRGGGACNQSDHAPSRGHHVDLVLAAITIFFAGFDIVEASLPSLIHQNGATDAKGRQQGCIRVRNSWEFS